MLFIIPFYIYKHEFVFVYYIELKISNQRCQIYIMYISHCYIENIIRSENNFIEVIFKQKTPSTSIFLQDFTQGCTRNKNYNKKNKLNQTLFFDGWLICFRIFQCKYFNIEWGLLNWHSQQQQKIRYKILWKMARNWTVMLI